MDTLTTQSVLLMVTLVTMAAQTASNVIRYREEKRIDREYSAEVQEYRDVVSAITEHGRDIEYLKRARETDKKEDMARMRIELVGELKRCIKQQFRTIIDIESIDPLLDIYFDDNHKGNGVVKELAKVYHALPIEDEKMFDSAPS